MSDEVYLGVGTLDWHTGPHVEGEEARMDVPSSWVPVPADDASRDGTFYRGHVTAFVLPTRHRLVYELIYRLRHEGQAGGPPGLAVWLKRYNDERPARQREATRWVMAVRGVAALADILGRHRHDSREDPELLQRARAVSQALDRDHAFIADPLPITHPVYTESVRTLANEILDVLADYRYGAAIAELAMDHTVGEVVRQTVVSIAQHALCDAAVQVSRTPLQAQVAQICDDTIVHCQEDERDLRQNHPDLYGEDPAARRRALRNVSMPHLDPLATANSAAGILSNVIGNTPFGTDSAATALAKVVFEYRIARRSRFADDDAIARVVAWYVRCIGRMTPVEQQTIEAAMRTGGEESVPRARHLLHERFQSSGAFNVACTVLSLIQLGYVSYQIYREGFTPGRAVEIGGAVVQVGGTVWVTAIRGSGLHEVPTEQWTRGLRRLNNFIEAIDRPLGAALAVVNVVQGFTQFVDGMEQEDYFEATMGAVTAVSGSLCAAGLLLAIPGLEPVGIALGLVAAGIQAGVAWHEANRPAWVRAYEALLANVEDERERVHWGGKFIERAELAGLRRAVEALASHLREHYADVTIGPTGEALRQHRPLSEGSQLATREIGSIESALRSLGFNDEQVRAMVHESRS